MHGNKHPSAGDTSPVERDAALSGRTAINNTQGQSGVIWKTQVKGNFDHFAQLATTKGSSLENWHLMRYTES